MIAGEPCTLTIGCVTSMTKVLKTRYIEEFAEMIRTIGKILELYCHKLEVCFCHAAIWTLNASDRVKKRKFFEATRLKHAFGKAAWALGLLQLGKHSYSKT